VQPGDLLVRLYIDGAWTDVTADVLCRSDDKIIIKRGIDDEATVASPGLCTLTLYDEARTGKYNNRVPGSPYYRKLGRNTPIEVSVDSEVRFVGEISSWQPRWDESEQVIEVPIEASGVLRRIRQGAKKLQPAIERAILRDEPAAYWPLTDGPDASRAASGLVGGKPMEVTGSIQFAVVDGLLGEGKHPELLDASGSFPGQLTGPVSYSDRSYWQIECWINGVSDGTADQMNALGFTVTDTSKMIRGEFNLVHDDGLGSAQVNIYLYDVDGNIATFISGIGSQTIDGDWHHVCVKFIQASPSTMDQELWIDGEMVDSNSAISGEIGRIINVYPPGRVPEGSVGFDSLSVAYLAVYNNDSDPADRYQGGIGHAGETAGRRIERLLDEEGFAFASVGNLDDSAAMGPQTAETLFVNLQACAVTDQGLLYETRTELGLTYRTKSSRYNQVGPLIDYGLLAPPLEPIEDDQRTWNDVTVKRVDGVKVQAILATAEDPHHTLTTADPPDGAGPYDRGELTISAETDDRVAPVAYWLRHLGTWDEVRYPSLFLQLDAPEWLDDADLTAEALALDTGAQLRLDGLPAWLPPDQVALHVQSYAETIEPYIRTLLLTVEPGWPWEVWQLDTGGSTLVAAVSDSATSFKIATSAGPPWSTSAEPYYLQAFGNAVKVTAMATDTPAFIAAGTVAHGNNASVAPDIPAGMTANVGQTLLGWAAIRNSGTGTVDLPSGYTELARSGNVLFFGAYYTGQSAPTITFTGGAANADTSARLWGMSGVSLELDNGRYGSTAPSPQALLNSSAANIAYPALSIRRTNCTAFVLAWKQDDATSVATPAAMDAEIMDNATTTGDDQHIAAYYDIQTAATDLAAGSLVVTGGGAAISRAITVALRPLQTATVERGVNGVATSIAAGQAVHGWRLGVLGL
jgi:hypothetical protein